MPVDLNGQRTVTLLTPLNGNPARTVSVAGWCPEDRTLVLEVRWLLDDIRPSVVSPVKSCHMSIASIFGSVGIRACGGGPGGQTNPLIADNLNQTILVKRSDTRVKLRPIRPQCSHVRTRQ